MAHRLLRLFALVALAGACGFGGSLAAQTPAASADVLGALLVEVRGLRAAMEQMASAGPRIELALGRLQLQEQRVNNLLRRQTEVRERLATAEREADAVAGQMEGMQQVLQQGALDENERRGLQQELAADKRRYTQMQTDVQRLRAEEADVAQLVATEQGRWTEINQQLEALERALARQ